MPSLASQIAEDWLFCNRLGAGKEKIMTILTISVKNTLIDGRQSERALMIRRGTQLLLDQMRHAVLPELSLASGRRADLISVSDKGEIWITEIKSSIEDFRVDRKWPDYRQHCDRLFFATLPDVPQEIFPQECGLIVSDGYGAHLLRDAPEHRLAPATRKSVMLAFSRAAAQRLMRAEWDAAPQFLP
ncbi:conserved hypothetical protein [Allorhizobium ampelinum S4]|uniref:MmcB family DNA repair protein n=2 Tax=Rhizobium/Agrobacterium group TaxID=227290 RepID=B9JXY8_ALLAM|nr:conserved hypothetical protein [Allorhizobium ampelinum S4]